MTQSWCQLGGISFPLLLWTAPSGWVKWYWNCFLLHLLLMYCFLLLFCFQQFICSLYFWFLSWIYVIIKLIRVAVPYFLRIWCWVVSVEGFSKMLCLICCFWQGEIWGFLVVPICKHFSFMAFDWSISLSQFSPGVSLFPQYCAFLS